MTRRVRDDGTPAAGHDAPAAAHQPTEIGELIEEFVGELTRELTDPATESVASDADAPPPG